MELGHNNPPLDQALFFDEESYRDRLAAGFAWLAERQAKLLDAGQRAPGKIEEASVAERATDYVKMLSAFLASAEAERKKMKAEPLRQGRTIDAFFGALAEPIMDARAKMSARLTTYLAEQRRVQEEAARVAASAAPPAPIRSSLGATASVRKSWGARQVDYAALDLEALRGYLDRSSIDKALAAFVRAGGREIRGAVIAENETVVVR